MIHVFCFGDCTCSPRKAAVHCPPLWVKSLSVSWTSALRRRHPDSLCKKEASQEFPGENRGVCRRRWGEGCPSLWGDFYSRMSLCPATRAQGSGQRLPRLPLCCPSPRGHHTLASGPHYMASNGPPPSCHSCEAGDKRPPTVPPWAAHLTRLPRSPICKREVSGCCGSRL
jgi:hypothetical protein